MDANRVKQILSSSADIKVEYNGASVWIDRLNEDGRTATIHLRGPLEERTTVAIADLKEVDQKRNPLKRGFLNFFAIFPAKVRFFRKTIFSVAAKSTKYFCRAETYLVFKRKNMTIFSGPRLEKLKLGYGLHVILQKTEVLPVKFG